MKHFALLFIVVVIMSFFKFLRNQKSQPTQREFKTTDEFVQWLASEAVKDAETGNGITLDYTPESIKSVDEILGKLHEQYAKNRTSISLRGLSAAYGAYIGEVIRRTEPNVHWERDDELGQKIYPLVWAVGHSYPMGWCQKRIENGAEDNVWAKYRVLKQRGELAELKLKK